MGNGGGSPENSHGAGRQGPQGAGATARPTLNASVRRRRADRAFSIRLAVIRQNERALERLKR